MKTKILSNPYMNRDYVDPMPIRIGFAEKYTPYGAEKFRAFFHVLSHYWHFGCEGLRDDDEFLREVSRCDSKNWSDVKGVVFGNFFVMDESGLWQNLEFKQEHEKIISDHRRRVAATAAARIRRLSSFTSPKAIAALKKAKKQNA